MKLLGVDFETTFSSNFDVKQVRITEVGAVLMDWASKTPLEILSTLVFAEDYPSSPPELVELTGITDEMLKTRGAVPKVALLRLTQLLNECDFAVAHNGTSFDRPIYFYECQRHSLEPSKVQWIDTRTDIPFPKRISERKLIHLASAHGFINPFQHRALFDVLTMMKILSYYDITQVVELAKQPLIHSIARVSFQDKDKAKERGYYWDGEKKAWFKPMKEGQFEQECKEAPFVCEKLLVQETYL